MGATACGGQSESISMSHFPTNMKVWDGALSHWNTKINWGLRNIPWADGWSVGSRYSHNLPGLRFQESPADDKNDFFFLAIFIGIHGTKYNCVLQWMLVHCDPKRVAIAPLIKGQCWTDFCVQVTLGTYCNSISALTIKPWLGAERLLLVSDLNTNKTTTTITSGLGRLGFYMDHRVTGSCWRDSWV